MKKILFNHASGLLMSSLLMTFVITSCTKKTTEAVPTANAEEMAAATSGSKPGNLPVVSLRMTVSDAGGNKITSDGGADYVNGTQNVKVVFDQNGNFMFNSKASNNPNVPMVRWLNYNFNDPISPDPILTGMEKGSFISTGKTITSPAFTPLQNLAIGATQCIGLSGGLINYDLNSVNFHRNLADVPNTPTAYVYVTRISQTQWTVKPVPPLSGGCSAISNVGAFIANGGQYVFYYNLPFSFTLTKLP